MDELLQCPKEGIWQFNLKGFPKSQVHSWPTLLQCPQSDPGHLAQVLGRAYQATGFLRVGLRANLISA